MKIQMKMLCCPEGEKHLNVFAWHCTFSCSQNSSKKLSYLPHIGKKLIEIGLRNQLIQCS